MRAVRPAVGRRGRVAAQKMAKNRPPKRNFSNSPAVMNSSGAEGAGEIRPGGPVVVNRLCEGASS